MAKLLAEPRDAARPKPPPISYAPADVFMRRLLRVPPAADRSSLLDARSAFGRSVVITGIRCMLTYLVIPIMGALSVLGTVARPLAMVLSAAGIFFAVRSARRFWMANHRYRWAYTAFAAIIVVYLTYALLADVLFVFSRLGR